MVDYKGESMGDKLLKVGFVGCGFVAGFHVEAFSYIRNADIVAVCSRRKEHAIQFAARAKSLGVGIPKAYTDVREMIRNEEIDALWILTPNYTRLEIVEAIVDMVTTERATIRAVAIEKPWARNVKEAIVLLNTLNKAHLLHGYLENQIFMPAIKRGKELIWDRGAAIAGHPYLARCAEEHSGPHRAWFWRADLQGGGALNDMMCHSLLAGWYLLTPPGKKLLEVWQPVQVVGSIYTLKWSRSKYAIKLRSMWEKELDVDYRRFPAEDYAAARVVLKNHEGRIAVIEGTASWCFVGPGLRLSFELLGPEYLLQINTLVGDGVVFFSRNIEGLPGEDLIEKQNAEQGQMPFIANEAYSYGYVEEDRHMINSFLNGRPPYLTGEEGVWITALLMAAYKSAEEGRVIKVDLQELEDYVPSVAKGQWHPEYMLKA